MALGVHPAGKLLDYEQYIEHQIRRTRSRIKEIDVLTAGLTLATAALGILFLEVVLDHAIGMPLWLRRAIAWSGASGGGAYAVVQIALPLFGRVSVFYAAKTIEDADPSFQNSLTTYLDLRRRRGQVSRAAFAAVEARAVKDLVNVEIDGVIDRRRLLRRAYALSGLVVLTCLYAAATPRSILDSARLALLADVARSRPHHIKVMPAPSITSVRVDLIAPPYTGIPPRMDVDGDMISAIEGTVVTVRARTNEPAASAYFEFDLGKGRWDRDSGIGVSGADSRLLLGKFTVSHPGMYTIRFKSTGGRVNPDPAASQILAFRDRPPTVRFLHPAEPDLTVPSNVKVPLLMTADDDHGVKDVLLTVRQGNDTLSTINLLAGSRPTGRFTGTFTIDLARAKVSPGTAVEYWLSVRDTKEPVANRTDSGRRIIRIAGPVSPEQARAIEEKAEREKAEAEKSDGIAERANLPGAENRRPDPGGRAVDVPGAQEKAAGAAPPSANPGDDPSEPGNRPQLGPEQIARLEEILNAIRVPDGRQAPRASSQPGTAPAQDAAGRHDRPAEPIAGDVPGAAAVAHAPTNSGAGSAPPPGAPAARSDPAPASGTEEPRAPDRAHDRKAGPGATGQGESQRTSGPPRRDGGEAGQAGPPGADPVRHSDAKGTRDQQRPGEAAGRARDEEDANRPADQAGGKATRGGQVGNDTRPRPASEQGRSPHGAAVSPGGDNARGKRPAVEDARRDPKQQAKPEAIDARRQVELPASKALTGATKGDRAKTQDEPNGPEKAKSIPPTRQKTTEKEKPPIPRRDPPRGLGQPPPQQDAESGRGPTSPDVPRRPERQPAGESPPPGEKKEPRPVTAGQPGETESGMPAGMPGPGGQKPSQVPHDNSSSPGRNAKGPNASKPPRPRSQQPASSRPKPRDKSASPPRDRSRTSKPAPPRDEPSAAPARPSTSPGGSGRSPGRSGRGDGPGAGRRPGGSSLVQAGSPADLGGAATSAEPGESGQTTTPDPSGRPPDGSEPSDRSRGAGSSGAPTPHPGAAIEWATSSRSPSAPGADDPRGGPASALGRSSTARDDPHGRPPQQSDGAGLPQPPSARPALRRGGDRDASGGPPLNDSSRPTPPSPSSPAVAAADLAPRNQRQTLRILRQLRDLIDRDQVPRAVLAAVGVRSTEELDQLVSRFEQPSRSGPGPGRTIESTPEDPPAAPPDLVTPAPEIHTPGSIPSLRHRGAFQDDAIRGNLEGPRFIPPLELRARFDAYRATLGQSTTPNP